MRGKEEESFAKAKDNYEQMQKMISDGTRFNFRHDLSVRIVPKGMTPVVDKKIIEIPIENTQDPGLPEPRRRVVKAKKKPAKKFHMPDGVETGFRTASKLQLLADGDLMTDHGIIVKRAAKNDDMAPVPPRESVLLSRAEEQDLERRYQNVAGNDIQEVTLPDLTTQTAFQRSLGPVNLVKHGQYTKRCVKLFKTLGMSQLDMNRHLWPYGDKEPSQDSWNKPELFIDIDEDEDIDKVEIVAPVFKQKATKRKPAPKPPKEKPVPRAKIVARKKKPATRNRRGLDLSDMEDEGPERDASDIESEGEGEVIRSEEPSEDSDDGEDLRDFIAGTNDSIQRDSNASQPTADSIALVVQDLGSDDALPQVSQVVGTAKAPRDVGLDLDNTAPIIGRRDKRRRVVEDSDSDE